MIIIDIAGPQVSTHVAIDHQTYAPWINTLKSLGQLSKNVMRIPGWEVGGWVYIT